MKNLLSVSASDGLCNCRIKQYPDGVGGWVSVQKMTSEKKIFNPSGLERLGCDAVPKFEVDSCVEADSKQSDTADSDRAVKRSRAKVLDLIRCNLDLCYFCTLTFNDDIVTRNDYTSVVRKFSQWCDNRVRRCGLKYVAVIEKHKCSDGLHFHLLCTDVLKLSDSGTVKCLGHKKPIRVSTADRYKIPEKDRKIVYNISDWCYGFSTAIAITGDEGLVKVSAYLQKYLTKDSEKVGGRYYYSGGELLRPRFLYCNDDFYSCDETYTIKVPGNTIKVLQI